MEIKKSEEVLAEVHRNCQLALQSISDILPETEDAELREELLRQHEDYEKIGGRAAILAKDKSIELKNPGPIKKAMMWSSIKMSTMSDNSRAHIAEMMVQGTVMGKRSSRNRTFFAKDAAAGIAPPRLILYSACVKSLISEKV